MVIGIPCWAEVDVADPDAAMGFYADLLGWTYTDDGGADHHRAVALAGGHPVAGIGSPGAAAPPAWTLYFAVEDADAAAESVEELAGMLLHGPEDDGVGGRLFVALDPGGATFGAWESDAAVASPGPGALSWVDGGSAEPGQARGFYGHLYDYTYADPPDDAPEYRTFAADGAGPLGGIGFAGDALPHWLVHFGVSDLDEALDVVRRAGGEVLEADGDRPPGRRAVVTDPFGARFALVALR